MPRITVKHLMIAVAVSALAVGLITSGRRKGRIEELRTLQQVRGWSTTGLILDNGRMVSLPGICEIPADSKVLAHATNQGVEIHPDGRVIGLVKIHHWCGNDPVGLHIARVNLAEMMMMLGEVAFDLAPEFAGSEFPLEGRFTEYGWDVGQYYQLRTFHWALENRKKGR